MKGLNALTMLTGFTHTPNAGGGVPLVLAAGRGVIPQARGSAATTNNVRNESRTKNNVFGSYSELRAVYSGFAVQPTGSVGVELNVGNAQAVQSALEVGGVTRRFKFGGADIGSVLSGAAELVSDAISGPFTGPLSVFQREQRDIAIGEFVSRWGSVRSMSGESTRRSNGLSASQLMNTGDLAGLPSGDTIFACFSPTILVGRPIGTPPDRWVSVGDSITAGEDDLYYGASSDGSDGGGWFGRACFDAELPFLTMAVSGTTAQQFVSSMALRSEYFKYVNKAVVGYGVNDLAAGRTPAQVWADLQTIYAALRSEGIEHIVAVNLPPRASSTDGFATTANQTVINGAATASLNGLIAGGIGTPTGADALLDLNALLRDAVATDKWAALLTDDGTHPIGPAGVVAIIKPAFAALL